MQKKLAFVMLCTLCAAAGFGQSAVFTEPKAGTTLIMGSAQLIAWTGSGSASVQLVLVSKNDGMQWNLKSGLAISAGSWPWLVGALESGKTAPAGANYLIRMQNMADGSIIAKSGLFSIAAAPAPLAVAKGKMNRPAETFSGLHPQAKEMVLASVPPPAGTPFTIKKIEYFFASEGKVGTVIVTISTNSPAGFYISPNYGNPEYGAQWIDYEIEKPLYEGFVCGAQHVILGRASVKGGGGSLPLNYPWSAVPAGPCDYFISFKPDYVGLAKGIGLVQKMASLPLQPGSLCRREFYPKLKIFFSACTAAGTVKSASTVYLVYDPQVWPLCWLSVPGETNSCAGGIQYW
jgi:hypothetical protein